MFECVSAFVVVASLGMCLGDPIPYAQDLGNCVHDKDCYISNTYCYQTGKCVLCTDCSLHQRRNATGVSCAKNKDQCGDCLPGKKAEINFDKSLTCGIHDSNFPNTEIVTTDSTTNSLAPDQNQNSSSTGWFIYSCIGIASVLLITFIIYAIMLFTKRCKTTVLTTLKNRVLMPSTSTEATAPNLNQMNNKEAVHEEYRRQLDYRPIESDRKLAANPFANPIDYVIGGSLPNYNPNEPENEPRAEEQQLIAPTTNLIDDEETIPSAWTPEIISPEDRLTSFANLNLNPSNSQPTRVVYSLTPHQDNNSRRDSFHTQEETASNENASYTSTNHPSSSSGTQVNIQIVNLVKNTQIK